MSRNMICPTMWYVWRAMAQTSLGIRTVWSEPLLVTWIFYKCLANNRTSLVVSKLRRNLHRLVWVYTCQNTTLLGITFRGSFVICVHENIFCEQSLLIGWNCHQQLCTKAHAWLCLLNSAFWYVKILCQESQNYFFAVRLPWQVMSICPQQISVLISGIPKLFLVVSSLDKSCLPVHS